VTNLTGAYHPVRHAPSDEKRIVAEFLESRNAAGLSSVGVSMLLPSGFCERVVSWPVADSVCDWFSVISVSSAHPLSVEPFRWWRSFSLVFATERMIAQCKSLKLGTRN
jgi:hypothetical protein